MPIPTDTFWNIKRLNVIFALAAVTLFAVTSWAIFQDHDKDWRIPQRHARIWNQALVGDRIRRQTTPQDRQTLRQLQDQIASKQADLTTHNKTYQQLIAQRKQLESDQSTLSFKLNNLKSNVQVQEAHLQDALAAGDTVAAEAIKAALAAPQKELAAQNETLFSLSQQLREVHDKLDAETAQLDELGKQRKQLAGDLDALQKKLISIDPSRQGGLAGLLGALSQQLRDAPLLDFINPSEKPIPIYLPDVLTDVAFMKITTVDKCMTCHVNIANKDFTEEKVLAYLQEQAATARKMEFPSQPAARAVLPQASSANPGPVVLPEFWHGWTARLSPATITKQAGRLGIIARAVGKDKPISISYAGQSLAEFKYDPKLPGTPASTKQDQILLALIQSLAQVQAPYEVPTGKDSPPPLAVEIRFSSGPLTILITGNNTDKPILDARNAAIKYIEVIHDALSASLEPDQLRLLQSRYRYALADVVNTARRAQGLAALDPSAVLLAHPQLDLYVDVDSPHSFEAVGCSSCHDGSGQETDFVLAAHSPRNIYVDAGTGIPVLAQQLTSPTIEIAHRPDLSSMLTAVFPTGDAIPKQLADLHFATPKPSTQPSNSSPSENSQPLAYDDPATGKTGSAITQMAWWKKTYEPSAPRNFDLVYHEWDWPMRTPDYLQANCARCHTDVYDIKESAPLLYQGRQMFAQLGCVNCHQMDSIPSYENRKVGTDLRHVTAKLSPAYINTWIWAPKAFRPTTKMPHFFMLENNSSNEELRRTRQEARAITEYLVRTATPLSPKYVYPPDGHGSADAGKAIFNTIGCLACHQNLNERGQEWITTDLVKRAGFKPDQAKAAYNAMSYNQRQLYVQQYLAELPSHNVRAVYPDGSPKPIFVQVGPELSAIGTKLLAGRTVEQARQWLFDWLMEPRHYSDYTIMPRLRLSPQQAMDLIEYLLDQKRAATDPNDIWTAALTPIDPSKLAELTGLLLRSRYSAQTATQKASDDAELSALAQAALTTPFTTPDQAKAQVIKMSLQEKQLVFLGQKLITSYGCMSCHAINGMENVSSPCTNLSDWGQKGVDKLDFGYLDHHKLESLPPTSKALLVNGLCPDAVRIAHAPSVQSAAAPAELAWPIVAHTRDAWITQKLKNTRVFDRGRALLEPSADDPGKPYDKLKMPTFYLNDDQVHAIVTFVLSNRDRLVSDRLTSKATDEQAKRIARGRELTQRYNCIACHQIERNFPEIQQYFPATDVITKAPPSLRGEGNKIQHAWLFNFFKNVEQMRPLLFNGIRMPSFPANDEEFTAIIAYFNAVSNKEAKQLAKQLEPVIKYVQTQRKLATMPTTQPDQVWPGDDWWQRREFAQTAQFLKDWGLTYGHIKPIEIGPLASQDDLRKVYRTLLYKAGFTRDLYEAPYPFVDSPRPEISDQRFAQGQHFFYEMQCLKCHVLGDSGVAGANKSPTAPNLALAYRRLQRRWIRHWVQEPNIIQVGTAMPPFFTGLPIFNLEGQPWPASQGVVPKEIQRIESNYGKTVQEQTDLLLDFLFAAGVRGFTAVQPATNDPGAPRPATTAPSARERDYPQEFSNAHVPAIP